LFECCRLRDVGVSRYGAPTTVSRLQRQVRRLHPSQESKKNVGMVSAASKPGCSFPDWLAYLSHFLGLLPRLSAHRVPASLPVAVDEHWQDFCVVSFHHISRPHNTRSTHPTLPSFLLDLLFPHLANNPYILIINPAKFGSARRVVTDFDYRNLFSEFSSSTRIISFSTHRSDWNF
jgi:hypothetical protein